MKNYAQVCVVNNAIVQENLSIIRDKATTHCGFQNAFEEVAPALLLEAFKDLPMTHKAVETPVAKCQVSVIDNTYQFILSPILRAGIAFVHTAQKMLPTAHVWFIGMGRDEKTHTPVWYYDKTPKQIENAEKCKVFILDPMLATGGSALSVIDLYIQKGIPVQNICFVCLIASPEGICAIQDKYPNISIITAAIDEKLTDNAFIYPGLGDAGDRFFNSL